MTEEDRILNATEQDEDRNDLGLRPVALEDFQGQTDVKHNLRVFTDAALGRGAPLDHVFISGPPGLGKTTLAGIMARELGTEFKITSAPALEKPKDLAGLLTSIGERAVFFIDEIHRLRPAMEEMLYVAMEDFELDWVIGQGPAARTVRVPIAPFTLVGATTKPGQVAGPLLSRFGISLRLELYSHEEICEVIRRSAGLLGLKIEESAVKAIAQGSRGTPRVANRLLRRVRDFAEVLGDGTVSEPVVRHAMKRLDIDAMGLERHDRFILRTIIEQYGGGPVGAETLAISVGEAVDTLEDFYEPYLIQCGFIKRTPRGRLATARAYEHLNMKSRVDENEQFLL